MTSSYYFNAISELIFKNEYDQQNAENFTSIFKEAIKNVSIKYHGDLYTKLFDSQFLKSDYCIPLLEFLLTYRECQKIWYTNVYLNQMVEYDPFGEKAFKYIIKKFLENEAGDQTALRFLRLYLVKPHSVKRVQQAKSAGFDTKRYGYRLLLAFIMNRKDDIAKSGEDKIKKDEEASAAFVELVDITEVGFEYEFYMDVLDGLVKQYLKYNRLGQAIPHWLAFRDPQKGIEQIPVQKVIQYNDLVDIVPLQNGVKKRIWDYHKTMLEIIDLRVQMVLDSDEDGQDALSDLMEF